MDLQTMGMISIFGMLVYLVMTGLGIYVLVLFIQLARRGIKALDIYINEKNGNKF